MDFPPSAAIPTVSLVVADKGDGAEMIKAIRSAGFAPNEISLANAGCVDPDVSTSGLLVVDLRGGAGVSLDECAGVANSAKDLGHTIIAAVAPGQIDVAASWWLEPPHRIMCDPTALEIAVVLVSTRSRTRNGVAARDDSENLRRLNSEVARIAETLARLTEAEEIRARSEVAMRDRSVAFVGSNGDANVHEESRVVRNIIRARRMRDTHFPAELFADPGWDILLDLYAAELEGQRVSVSSLCIAAAVPGTTALRWIGTMMEASLLQRHADPFDRRRAYITLSDTARESMQRYFDSIQRAGILPL